MKRIEVGSTAIWSSLRVRQTEVNLGSLEFRMSALFRQLPGGWPVGLERMQAEPLEYAKLATGNTMLLAGMLDAERGNPSDPKYAGIASELVLRRVWRFCPDGKRDTRRTIRELARWTGEGDKLRSTPCVARNPKLGLQIEYEAPAAIPLRLRRLEQLIQSGSDLAPIYFAIGVMMEFLVIHPFADGNGRVARALFQLTLADRLNLPAPVFPLLPLMIFMRRQLYAAYLAWEIKGDCSQVCDLIAQWLWQLVGYYEGLLSASGSRD